MPYTRPTKLPRYTFLDDGNGTDNDVVNPTSGQNNVVEPSEAKKDLGWDFKEFPPRNWMNWLHRLTGQWLGFLNQQEQDHETRITLGEVFDTAYAAAVAENANTSNLYFSLQAMSADYIAGMRLRKTGTLRLSIDPGSVAVQRTTAFNGTVISTVPNTVDQLLADWLTASHPAPAANTWYHLFYCIDTTKTTSWSYKADTDIGGATILGDTTYTHLRRIGSVLTDATPEIIDFFQRGDMFYWKDNVKDVNGVAVPSSYPMTAYGLTTPEDVEVDAFVNIRVNATGSAQWNWVMDGIQNPASGPNPTIARQITAAGGNSAHIETAVRTNLDREIYLRSGGGAGSNTTDLYTIGWKDPRGRKELEA